MSLYTIIDLIPDTPASGWYGEVPDIYLFASSGGIAYWQWNSSGGSWTSGTAIKNSGLYAGQGLEGDNTLYYYTSGAAEVEGINTQQLLVDTGSPGVFIDPMGTYLRGSGAQISVSGNNVGSDIYAAYFYFGTTLLGSGVPVQTGDSWEVDLTFDSTLYDDGEYDLQVNYINLAETGGYDTVTVILDNDVPRATIDPLPSLMPSGQNIVITGKAEKNTDVAISNVQYSLEQRIPILYCKFDGNYEGLDYEDAIVDGSPSFVSGKFGSGVSLGSADRLRYSATEFNVNIGTCKFWFKPSWNGNDNTLHKLFAYSIGSAKNSFILQKTTSNNLEFIVYDKSSTAHTTSSDVSSWVNGTWYLIQFKWDINNGTNSSDIYLEIDGTEVDSITLETISVVDSDEAFVEIGATSDGANGVVDEFKILDNLTEINNFSDTSSSAWQEVPMVYGSGTSLIEWSTELTGLDAGAYFLRVRTIDLAGNKNIAEETNTSSVVFEVDTE